MAVRVRQAAYAIDSVEVWDAAGKRVLYRFDEQARTVTVLRIDHRGDVYRTP